MTFYSQLMWIFYILNTNDFLQIVYMSSPECLCLLGVGGRQV